MIPDFKTYINETYWSRMNRRSQGTLTKKEDGLINHMNNDKFADYLNDKYRISSYNYEDKVHNNDKLIWLPIYTYDGEDGNGLFINILFDDNDRNFKTIYVEKAFSEFEIFDDIGDEYDIKLIKNAHRDLIYDKEVYEIKRKDGKKFTNESIIEFLDFVKDLDSLNITIHDR